MRQRLCAYFVSDLHLGSVQEPNYQLFLKFLNQLKTDPPSHLFLVGDVFDIWVSDYAYFKDEHRQLITALQELQQNQVEIHYFEGNHDLYLRQFWHNQLGFKIHEGPAFFNIGEMRLRVEHGDQVDREDRGYLFLRWFLRTSVMKWLARNLPEKLVVKIGQGASAKSRQYTSTIKTISGEESIRKLHEHALREWRKQAFDFLISGHIHVRDDYVFEVDGKSVRSVNLGTWLVQPCAFVLDEKGGRFVEIT